MMKRMLWSVLLLIVVAVTAVSAQVIIGIEGQIGTPMLKYGDQTLMKVDREYGAVMGAPVNEKMNLLLGVNIHKSGSENAQYVKGQRMFIRGEYTPLIQKPRNVLVFAEISTTHNEAKLSEVKNYESVGAAGGFAIIQKWNDLQLVIGMRYAVQDMENLNRPTKFTVGGFSMIRYVIH